MSKALREGRGGFRRAVLCCYLVLIALVSGCGVASPSAGTSSAAPASPSPEPSVEQSPDLESFHECSDAAGGYRVRYPGNWLTNDPSPGAPACRALSDVGPFGLPDEIPPYVRVWILLQTTEPQGGGEHTVSEQHLEIGGQPAIRWEQVVDSEFIVIYAVDLPRGGWLVAGTSSSRIGDYAANVAVLDWMMAALVFVPTG